MCKTSRFLKLDPTCLLSLRKHSPLCEDLLSWQCFPLFAMPADLVAFLPYVNHFSSHFFIQHVSSMYASAQIPCKTHSQIRSFEHCICAKQLYQIATVCAELGAGGIGVDPVFQTWSNLYNIDAEGDQYYNTSQAWQVYSVACVPVLVLLVPTCQEEALLFFQLP